MTRSRCNIVVVGLSILILGACTSQPTNSPSDTPTKVGGMTECTVEAVQPFVTAYIELSDANNQMPIKDLQCANGWAVASGILGLKNAPSDGPQGAPTSIVLEAEGQFWIVKDKVKVCGTYNAEDPETVPTDAEIPGALYLSGCLAG